MFVGLTKDFNQEYSTVNSVEVNSYLYQRCRCVYVGHGFLLEKAYTNDGFMRKMIVLLWMVL